mgnify:CR=1 FL=1
MRRLVVCTALLVLLAATVPAQRVAIGDRLFDLSGVSLQLNSYLYSPGIRWYPFTTGLVLGAHAGASRILIQSSSAGTNASP